MDGWIKLQRSIKDHWIWSDPIKLKWWIDLLITVNHSPTKVNIGNQIFECGRGQSIQSLSTWARQWNVSKDKVRNFFVLLEKDGMISHENIGKSTRITVCKYDDYQGESEFTQAFTRSLHDSYTDDAPKSTRTKGCISNIFDDELHNETTVLQRSNNDETTVTQHKQESKECKNNKRSKRNTCFDYQKSDVSFIQDEFKQCFLEWLEYKKHSLNFSYKTEGSCKAAYNELLRLSGSNPTVATEIVNRSIANGWKGLFPLSNKTSNTTPTPLEFEKAGTVPSDGGYHSTL